MSSTLSLRKYPTLLLAVTWLLPCAGTESLANPFGKTFGKRNAPDAGAPAPGRHRPNSGNENCSANVFFIHDVDGTEKSVFVRGNFRYRGPQDTLNVCLGLMQTARLQVDEHYVHRSARLPSFPDCDANRTSEQPVRAGPNSVSCTIKP